MENAGVEITSAAIPAFQQKPNASEVAASK